MDCRHSHGKTGKTGERKGNRQVLGATRRCAPQNQVAGKLQRLKQPFAEHT